MQISFSWLEKATGNRVEVWWAEAATPCLVLVMPRRVRKDGNSKTSGEKSLIWSFKAVFRCLFSRTASKLPKLLVFHWTALNFRELIQKFLPSPLRHSRCLPLPEERMTAGDVLQPSHGENAVSVLSIPAQILPCPGRSSPSARTCRGSAATGGAGQILTPDSSGCGSSLGELRGKWDAGVAGTGGNCSSSCGSETTLGTLGGHRGDIGGPLWHLLSCSPSRARCGCKRQLGGC